LNIQAQTQQRAGSYETMMPRPHRGGNTGENRMGEWAWGGRGGKQARTFPVTLRYKESNSPGEIHVNVNAGSAVR